MVWLLFYFVILAVVVFFSPCRLLEVSFYCFMTSLARSVIKKKDWLNHTRNLLSLFNSFISFLINFSPYHLYLCIFFESHEFSYWNVCSMRAQVLAGSLCCPQRLNSEPSSGGPRIPVESVHRRADQGGQAGGRGGGRSCLGAACLGEATLPPVTFP